MYKIGGAEDSHLRYRGCVMSTCSHETLLSPSCFITHREKPGMGTAIGWRRGYMSVLGKETINKKDPRITRIL